MAALSIYVIGEPGSGKSSVFDALTRTADGGRSVQKGAHRLGTVKVPDPRLEKLREMYQPKKYTPAEITFADMGGQHGAEGAAVKSEREELAQADTFVVVVQAFGEFDRAGRPLDPAAQLRSLLLELILSDLELVETRLERIEKEKQRGRKPQPGEEEVLLRCQALLEQERPLIDMELNEEEQQVLKSLRFLSQKPCVLVANLDESLLDGSGLEGLQAEAARLGSDLLRFCAPLEADIAQLTPADQRAFLADYGIDEPARPRLLRAAYRALDVISFFTVGDDEVRAWTLRRGSPAQRAGGKIHSDIERGFIRAEVVAADALLAAGNMAACREQATLRLEGKTYVVQDGDVINFRFNV